MGKSLIQVFCWFFASLAETHILGRVAFWGGWNSQRSTTLRRVGHFQTVARLICWRMRITIFTRTMIIVMNLAFPFRTTEVVLNV
ncbi:MAG: hypothetical protein CMM07_13680 [Rhodopirellula sp.]|nr:hypothetical protein [Rhodopirellula sp.]